MDAQNGSQSCNITKISDDQYLKESSISEDQKEKSTDEMDGCLEEAMSCIDDLEAIASKKLGKVIFDYYRRGADEEHTLRWNRSMISMKYCLKPKVMVDVSSVSLTKYVFGDKVSVPFGISPTAMHMMAHPDGELATIRACKRANSLMILSLFSTTSLEDVAKEAPVCTKWQNLYILKNREITKSVINRAKRFGFRAIVVTCDAPTLGKRRSDEKNKLKLGDYCLANIDDSNTMSIKDHAQIIFDSSLTWEDLADIKNYVGDTMTVIAKGIMTPHDAEEAIRAGVDGIFVSNHGGRQLDCVQATVSLKFYFQNPPSHYIIANQFKKKILDRSIAFNR